MSRLPHCAIWLYGSHARGDADADSDVDLFVASDEDIPGHNIEAEAGPLASRGSVSRYSWFEVQGMAAYGSLFLQHLRLEGRPLYESYDQRGRLAAILSMMGGYRLADRDLRGFRAVLEDVAGSLGSGGPEIFELSVLGTVLRHASILGCWLLRRPAFGRTEPVARLVASTGLASTISIGFPDLYCFRLFVDGRLPRGMLPPLPEPVWWLRRAREVAACVEALNDACG